MFLLCLEYTSCIFDGADKRIWLFLLEIKIGTEQQFVAVSKQTMEIIKKKNLDMGSNCSGLQNLWNSVSVRKLYFVKYLITIHICPVQNSTVLSTCLLGAIHYIINKMYKNILNNYIVVEKAVIR